MKYILIYVSVQSISICHIVNIYTLIIFIKY